MDNIVLKKDDVQNNNVATVTKDGIVFAGTHLLIDLYGAINLNNPQEIETVLRNCAIRCGATILHSHMHHFNPQGVSGVVVLAESHISIHTWPETGYIALDIFMCGSCNPYDSIPLLKEYFKPSSMQLIENKRGITI
jgi:S-adenosylmethionine decarboxylase